MDTRLKKSKRIRSLFYRMIAVGALAATLATGILGREALVNLYREGFGTLTGSIYYSTEFREFIALLYNKGMLGYGGIGDDNGYPLQNDRAEEISLGSREDFLDETDYVGNNLLYYIEYDGQIMESNISYPLFSEYDGHLLLPEDTRLCCYWDGESGVLEFFSEKFNAVSNEQLTAYYDAQYQPRAEETGKIKLLLAVKEPVTYSAMYSGYLSLLAYRMVSYKNILIAVFSSAFVTILFWFLGIFSVKAGKQAKKDYALLIAKVPAEIRLLAVLGMIYFCHFQKLMHFGASVNSRIIISANWGYYFPAGILLYLLYIDLKGNGESILKQSFVYRIYSHFRQFHAGLPWYRKAMNMYHVTFISSLILVVTGTVILCLKIGTSQEYFYVSTALLIWLRRYAYLFTAASFLLGIPLLLISFRLKGFVKDVSSISDKLAAVSAGKESLPLEMNEHSLLTQTAKDLNAVDNGIQTAVDQRNRSNKMRVELLANVSHDLKTPLTSIINYAELLCEEELPAPTSEYAEALRTKAYRLKSMVQDVFDLSKATSGNLHVEKTKLDLVKLIRQTLTDMDEQIAESSVTFKLNISTEPLLIEADGEKLYRVFQNLILNALQYSLENSRVHIQLEQKDGFAYARIKNTSRQELNFSAEEIVERFVRADSSRTSEGSGLGLSIVQSFTEACGGTFTIEMDADLFTACVAFPLVTGISKIHFPEENPAEPTKPVEPTLPAETLHSTDSSEA